MGHPGGAVRQARPSSKSSEIVATKVKANWLGGPPEISRIGQTRRRRRRVGEAYGLKLNRAQLALHLQVEDPLARVQFPHSIQELARRQGRRESAKGTEKNALQ